MAIEDGSYQGMKNRIKDQRVIKQKATLHIENASSRYSNRRVTLIEQSPSAEMFL